MSQTQALPSHPVYSPQLHLYRCRNSERSGNLPRLARAGKWHSRSLSKLGALSPLQAETPEAPGLTETRLGDVQLKRSSPFTQLHREEVMDAKGPLVQFLRLFHEKSELEGPRWPPTSGSRGSNWGRTQGREEKGELSLLPP